MLTLKRMIPIYVLALLALMFVSCDEDTAEDWKDPLDGAVLAVSANTVEVGADGADSSEIIVVSNSGNEAALRWEVSTTTAWVTFTSSSGATPSEFQIMGEANETGLARSGSAIVRDLDLDKTALTITVTQPTTGPVFCISDTVWTAAALGEESPYIFLDNCGNANAMAWTAANDSTWLTLSATSGNTPDSITITVDPNDTGEAREDTITVEATAEDTSYVIVVDQGPIVSLASLGYDTDGSARDVFVAYDLAFVADLDGGLVIFDLTEDLTDTTELAPLATFATTGDALAVHVFGDYAYVAEGPDGVEIINISTASAPTLAGSFVHGDDALDVYVRFGDTAYVAIADDGLSMLDISDTANLAVLDEYDTDGSALGVHVSGNYMVGSYAYVADDNQGLKIVDYGAPSLAGTFDDGSTNSTMTGDVCTGVDVVGSTAYVVEQATGLHIVDASNPASPVELGAYVSDDARGVRVSGDSTNASGVHISGDYAFVADGVNGLLVIGPSDPANPTLAGSFDTDGEAYAVYINQDLGLALVADGDNGLVILALELWPEP